MRRHFVLIALVATLIVPAAATAAPRAAVTSPADTALGRQLVDRYWRLLQANDHPGLQRFLSPAFQIQRADGTGATRDEYIPSVGTKVVVVSYRLSRFVVTRSQNILVARFAASTDELIDGQAYSKQAEPRIATFARSHGAWRITSNANFNAPSKG